MCVVYVCLCMCGAPASSSNEERAQNCVEQEHYTHFAFSLLRERLSLKSKSIVKRKGKKKISRAERPLAYARSKTFPVLPLAQVWPLRCQRLSMKYVSVHAHSLDTPRSERGASSLCAPAWQLKSVASSLEMPVVNIGRRDSKTSSPVAIIPRTTTLQHSKGAGRRSVRLMEY